MSSVSQIPIGKFSLMTRLTPKALRLYDQKGLLTPGAKDPFTGYRYYTLDQVEEGMKIKMLATFGFGIDEISTI
ncbi:MAG: MerR family transcriptional regulator, partial [Candidatus Kariarchaeaceae archaeon]